MRPLLICVGSRGDAEPFCALARAFDSKQHKVDLFLQKDLKHLAPTSTNSKNDVTLHELPFTQMDFYKYVSNPSHGSDDPNPRVRFIGVVTDCIGELVFPCADKVFNVAKESKNDIIVTSSLARPLAIAISRKLQIPLCIINLQPLAPTGAFPHSSSLEQCVGEIMKMIDNTEESSYKPEFEESYWELEKFQHEFLEERAGKAYESIGLSRPINFQDDLKKILSGKDESVIMANAFSSEVIPKCPDHEGTNIMNIGPLMHDYNKNNMYDWTPPFELTTFLEKKCQGNPPICVGYGSMPFDKATLVIEALQSLNKKAILVGNAFQSVVDGSGKAEGPTDDWMSENVIQVSDIPYSWLLPKCSMMLCHGGAGVMHATLYAGIPVIISPLMGDQFFWVKLLEAREIGIQAGSSLTQITKNDLVAAIQKADNEEYKSKSKRFGELLNSKPSGVEVLVDTIESKLCK